MAKTVSLRQRGWPWDELREGPSARNEACRSPQRRARAGCATATPLQEVNVFIQKIKAKLSSCNGNTGPLSLLL